MRSSLMRVWIACSVWAARDCEDREGLRDREVAFSVS